MEPVVACDGGCIVPSFQPRAMQVARQISRPARPVELLLRPEPNSTPARAIAANTATAMKAVRSFWRRLGFVGGGLLGMA
ncbi:hypothetical protein D3C87_1882280 [compost metagenome]